ncbi:MAG: glycosyltransferase family 2 protein [Planctomycetota bacterium]|nr:glycosyltransferase family 2 protein [Planctomycetota bacterium]MEE2895071.1 glycosyltransferase family 2 protein [Planctomycetota bacterium]
MSQKQAAHTSTGSSRVASSASDDRVDVSILVVSYNTREMTIECLRSVVRETEDLAYEVLVMDNRSEDGSFEAIHGEFGDDPRFRCFESPTNLGFAGANNELARSARGEYVLLLNPDTVVLDGAIQRLVDFARQHDDHGIWGGRTLFADGSLNPTNCWRRYTIWSQFCRYFGLTWFAPGSGLFNPRAYAGWKRDSIREVDIVTGCFFLMRRSDWERLEGFDPEFFMYGEEVDLCLRARRLGLRAIVTPDAEIVHHGGASERVLEDKRVRLLTAEIQLQRRHWSPPKAWLGRMITRGGVLLRSVASTMARSLGRSDATSAWNRVWGRRGEWLRGG